METSIINALEVVITIVLIYGALLYWKRKLLRGYDIESSSIAYTVFISSQILTILFMVLFSIDPQNSAYLESLTLFSKGADNLWTTMSIQLFGLTFLFILSNVVGHLLFKVSKNDHEDLYSELSANKLSSSIVASVIIFAIGVVTSNFILKPFIYNWISEHVGIIPLN